MNERKIITLSVALLLATGRLAAHTAQGSTAHIPAHEHPNFAEVTTVFKFDDGTEVKWKVNPAAANTYTVTVTQVPVAQTKIYSLLTLGMQSIRDNNRATLVKGNDVMLYTHGNATGTPWGPAQPLAKTGLGASGKLDPDKILFVSFSGRTCEFTVEAPRPPRAGDTSWQGQPSPKSGHDNTPPDAYPN